MPRAKAELMCLFLMCDEDDPAVDYNLENYLSRGTYEYELEVDQFLQGIEYLLSNITDSMDTEQLNTVVFDAARISGLDIKLFFSRVYQTLFKQRSGPRLAAFISLLGTSRFVDLLQNRLRAPLNY